MQQNRERSLAYKLSITHENIAEITSDELSMVSGAQKNDGGVLTSVDTDDPTKKDSDTSLAAVFFFISSH